MRLLAWFGTNEGRIVSGVAIASELAGQAWNIHLHQPIDLGPGGLGGGLAAILTASAALVAAPPAANAMLARQRLKLARMNMRDEGDLHG